MTAAIMQIFFSYVLNLKICLHYAKNCLQQLTRNQSIVSVAAGIKYESLKNSLPTDKIFRAMPNVGAKDNLGITAIFSHSDNSEILRIFKFLGEAYEVENEDQIDLHTVLLVVVLHFSMNF